MSAEGLKANKPKKPVIQVLTRALSIVRTLESEPKGLSLGEIAKRVSLPRSTVQRIVGALENESVVISTGQGGGVILGPALARLGAGLGNDLSGILRQYNEELSKSIAETVDLSVVRGVTGFVVDQVTAKRRLQASSVVGFRFPLHCTAQGKALLALGGDNLQERIFASKLERYTENTLTDWQVINKEIEHFLETGIAYDREEHVTGVSAIAIGGFDLNGAAFSISVPVPTTRFNIREDELVDRLILFRDEIASSLNLKVVGG